MVSGLYDLRAVHGQDFVLWQNEQRDVKADDGCERSYAQQGDQEGNVQGETF